MVPITHLLHQAADRIADSPWEASRKATAAFIRDAGGAVSATEINRNVRGIDRRTRMDLIADLLASGEISEASIPGTAGRPAKQYLWLG